MKRTTFFSQLTAQLVFIALALLCSPQLMAQSTSGNALWELGGFALGLSQQAYPGSDQQVNRALTLPYFVYRGEVLRADRDTAGLRALKTDQFELDVGFAGSFGAGNNEIEARRGMKRLGTLVELGPRLRWHLGAAPGGGRFRAEFPLRGVFDLDDSLASKGLAFEPALIYDRQAKAGWRYSVRLGAIWADPELARTFYEVSTADATALRPAYAAGSGLVSWRASSFFFRELSPDWRVFGFVRFDSVAGAANQASPLVRQTTGSTVGLGVTYTWMRSEQRARD
jgi:MipA family protein